MEHILRSLVAQNSLMTSRISALESLVAAGGVHFGPMTDPAPDGGGWGGGRGGGWGGGFGGWGGGIPINFDPAPEELGKLSRVQIESRLAEIAHFRTKLDLLEKTLSAAFQGG